jgi:hypothetical protein
MLPVPELAAAAVTVLAPYLQVGATELVKKLGSTTAEHIAGLYDKLKARLASSGKEALADLEKAPADVDAQGALRHHLKKQLADDPSLQAHVAKLVEALRSPSAAAVLQTASITGDGNISVQIAGSGNQVGGLGKPT